MKKIGRLVWAVAKELFLEKKDLVLGFQRESILNRDEEKEQTFKDGNDGMDVKKEKVEILLEDTAESILQKRNVCADGN